MPIFGAKSRAARGCASKLACGRRIDPHGAHSFLRYAAANLRLPQRADRVVRPYRALCAFADGVCNFAIAFCGSMWASTPTEILHGCRSLCRFLGAPCAGGAEPRPYGFPKGASKKAAAAPQLFYVFFSNRSPHLGQRMLMRPLPRGTRTVWLQRGQRK